MIDSFKRFITRHSLFTSADKLLLTVSGGVDSMVMADLFLQSDYTFAVAHCNFKLRNQDSDQDELLVKQWCEKNQIEFYSTSFNTKMYAEENQLSIQMAARNLRYTFFNEICKQHQLKYIVTAHHADDFAETVIIKLLRQYGSAALHGILPKDGNRVHPLLFATKNKILQYAKQHQLKWREDASNDSDAYQRNKIRRHLLPLLQEMNPSFSTNLVEQSEFVYGEDKIIRSYLENVSKQIVTNNEKEVILSIADLKNTLAPLTILYHLIEPFGFSMSQSVSLFNSLSSTESKNFHSEKYCITKNRNELVIFPHTNINSVYFEITDCGVYEYNGKVITVKYEEKSLKEIELSKNTNPYQAWFDAGEVSFPIIIRNKKDGDRFLPFGMTNHKKLSDFFIDLKYSAAEKENQWLMESNKEIFWVVGKRISDRAKVRGESNRILKISVKGV